MPSTSDSDLKTQALTNSTDFYDLLSIPATAQSHEIRRAYRKTAPKYHPDKVGTSDPSAVEKFYLLQIAYDVLSDPAVRELYDHARKARLAKVEREGLLEGRRREMMRDLERREKGVGKRGREEDGEDEEAFARELRRLAEDGKRRRMEREEALRREKDREVELEKEEVREEKSSKEEVSDLDRSITLRFPLTETTRHLNDKASLEAVFEAFGTIDEVILREKKLKLPGEKHRMPYITAIVVYHSIVGAHAAMTDFPAQAREEPEKYGIFEAVDWAAGREPDFVPKTPGRSTTTAAPAQRAETKSTPDSVKVSSPFPNGSENGSRKAPTFGSFKGGVAAAKQGASGPTLDETMMMRLKNAEKRRMEEKIRREEAAAEAVENGNETDATDE